MHDDQPPKSGTMSQSQAPQPAGTEFAPAKVNLALHVVGRRDDGYHLLDSLVAFADIGDHLSLTQSDKIALNITGPRQAFAPADATNLAWQAAEMMGATPAIDLDKHLPAAAGIGGGSADAAAVMRLLARDHGVALPAHPEKLGADIPVCLLSRAARMQGIGERITPIANFPELHGVLANPGAILSTPDVFAKLHKMGGENDLRFTRLPSLPKQWNSTAELITWLRATRNDLAAPAVQIAPKIADVLTALHQTPECLFAQLSGSGATCFGLYATREQAEAAAASLADRDWWIAPVTFG